MILVLLTQLVTPSEAATRQKSLPAELTPRQSLQEAHGEWEAARTTESLDGFVMDGDSRYFLRVAPLVATPGGSTTLSRQVHTESETVTIGGAVSGRTSGSTTWSVQTREPSGKVTTVTHTVVLGQDAGVVPFEVWSEE